MDAPNALVCAPEYRTSVARSQAVLVLLLFPELIRPRSLMKPQPAIRIFLPLTLLFLLACGPLTWPEGTKDQVNGERTEGPPIASRTAPIPGQLAGTIVGVHDGDTITLLTESRERHKIRMTGIDAPELGQDFGRRSKENLSGLLYSKEIVVLHENTDRNGRILGKIVMDGEDINLRQIEDGFAWYYKAFERDVAISDRPLYAAAETRARDAQKGLWSQIGHIPPWVYRKTKGTR